MGAMYEKGQTKRYSRVASFKNGEEVKSERSKKSAALRRYERETRRNMTEPERAEYQELARMRRGNEGEAWEDMKRNAMSLIGMKKGGGVGSSMQSAGERIMRGLKPTIDEVVKRRPAMKHGGKVSRYGGGGETESEDKKKKATEERDGLFGGYGSRKEQLEAMGLRRGGRVKKMAAGGESKAMIQRELAFMRNKGAPKSMVKHEEAEMKNTKNMAIGGASAGGKNIPEGIKQARARKANKKPRPARPKSEQMPKPRQKPRPARPKSGQMPRPRGPRLHIDTPMPPKGIPKRARPMGSGAGPGFLNPMGRSVMKAGGDVYTTPGAPTRGKSGKPMKKYAAGGMIPSAGKKSPSSMGTPYRAGGSIKPKKYSGGGGIDGCAMRGKTRAPRGK